MTVTVDYQATIDRLRNQINSRFAPPKIRAAAHKIGMMLEANMKISNRAVLRVRTGRLINSLAYRIKQNGDVTEIEAGSFGVPYAAIHEFGGMAGRKNKTKIPARPYIRPAYRKTRPYIINILRELAK